MSQAEAHKPRPRIRWWIAALLFAATLINYLDRQTFAIATPEIAAEFQLKNEDVAVIINAFQSAYTIGQLLMGRLMDQTGVRFGFVIIMALWSAAGILCALARGVFSFSFFRFLLGIGEAGNWPVSVKAISEWFPASQRGFGIAVFTNGSTVGAMLAPLIIGQLILWGGWRWAFVLIGLSGFLWLPVWIWFYRRPREHWLASPEEIAEIERGSPASRKAKPTGFGGMVREWAGLLRHRQIWGVTLVRFFTDSVLWFYIAWMPKYLADERGFEMQDIRDRLWMVFLPAIFTALFGGAASGRLIARGWSIGKARKTVMLISGLLMCSSAGIGLVESDFFALALASLAICSFYANSVNALTLPTDLVPPRLVASVSGLSGTGAGIGSILFTYVVGQLADAQSFTPVFVLVGCLPIAALVMLFLVMGPVKRVVEE